jgi:hypothetical protein
MNWRRGLFRAWLVLSVLWLSGVGLAAYSADPWEYHDLTWRPSDTPLYDDILKTAKTNMCGQHGADGSLLTDGCWYTPTLKTEIWRRAKAAWLLAFAPPAVLFVLGAAGLWVGRGFRRA